MFPSPRKARPSKTFPVRRGKGRERASLHAVPWIALAAMLALWPSRANGLEDRAQAEILKRETGRGRHARSPGQIPAAGWRDIVWRTWSEFNSDRITTVAGGVTFFGILALFPGLAAFVSLYGLFADIHDAQKQIMALAGVAPRDAVVFIGEQMIRIAAQRPSNLSITFVVSLLLSLWSANSGMKAFINGLNIAYDETEKRSFILLTLQSLAFTLAGLVFVLVCVAGVVALPLMLPFLDAAGPLLSLLRWPVLLVMTMLALAVVYRYGPSREHPRWRWVSWGSVTAALLWLIASFAYSWYLANMAHYDKAYGPFGAAAGAMTWMWISVIIVMIGAELNSEIEHQTTVDSTTGAPEPMGKRGAAMADTVGAPAGPPYPPGWTFIKSRLKRPPADPPTKAGTVRP